MGSNSKWLTVTHQDAQGRTRTASWPLLSPLHKVGTDERIHEGLKQGQNDTKWHKMTRSDSQWLTKTHKDAQGRILQGFCERHGDRIFCSADLGNHSKTTASKRLRSRLPFAADMRRRSVNSVLTRRWRRFFAVVFCPSCHRGRICRGGTLVGWSQTFGLRSDEKCHFSPESGHVRCN